jgi:TetR/AcrR family transcriptional repressor of bet genes
MKATRSTTDKRRIRGEESRKAILNAAIDSIANLGLGKLTLDRVADRVGISRGLVVFHFRSKDKLIEEVLDYLGKQYSSGWAAILDDEADSDMSKLLRLIDYDIRFACDNPGYVSVWHAFWGESKGSALYHEKAAEREEGYSKNMENLLKNISQEVGFDKQELSLVTRGLLAMMFGIWVQLHLNPTPNAYETNIRAVRLFLTRMFPNVRLPDLVTD